MDKITEIQRNQETVIQFLKTKLDSMVNDDRKIESDEVEDHNKISKHPLKSRRENTRVEFYPESNVEIKMIPLDKISWSKSYKEYCPNEYTSQDILYNLAADVELLNK